MNWKKFALIEAYLGSGAAHRLCETPEVERQQARRDYAIVRQFRRDSMYYLAETVAERVELNDRWLERILIDHLIRSGSPIAEGGY